MDFPKEYFDDEVREGFYVDSLMKRTWAAQLEVLEAIAKVCDKYGIRWYADCGTLLGAVRHGGYIPWDDDLDICMLRDDYTRFKRVAEKELPEGYRLFDYGCEKDYWNLLLRVTNGVHIDFTEEHLKKYHGFPYVAGVDIFPLDFGAPNEEEEENRSFFVTYVQTVANRPDIDDNPSEETMQLVREVEEDCGIKIDYSKPLKKQLYDITVGLFAMYRREEATEVMLMTYWTDFKTHKYALEWFDQTIELPFETTTVKVPAGYDGVLKVEYGDYMKLIRSGGVHDYPHYQVQEKEFLHMLKREKLPYRYYFDAEDLKARETVGYPRPKEQAQEFLTLLTEAHQEIVRCIALGEHDSAVELLEQCQDGAIQIGTLIEETLGEGFVTVKHLEDYCELAYQIHEELLQGCVINADQVSELLQKALGDVKVSVETDMKQRREVVFLPVKASMWDALESVWRAACEDPDCDVYVIPIPYFDKDIDGRYHGAYYEIDQFPDYVPVVDFNRYDFQKRHPDVIVIQTPYDECHFSTTVHPFFYAKNLKQYTEKLVYIPFFVLDEIQESDERAIQTMDYFVTTPGVVFADAVIVQSEPMKKRYVEKLTKMAGEETRGLWEEKIQGIGSPKWDATSAETTEIPEIPEEWKPLLMREDGSLKKVILYVTSVSSFIQYKGKILQKMRDVFEIFRNNRDDAVLLWRPDPMIPQTISNTYRKLWKDYRRLIHMYQAEGFGIYDDSEDVDRAVALADAYYGDACNVVKLCRCAGMPIMLQDVDV